MASRAAAEAVLLLTVALLLPLRLLSLALRPRLSAPRRTRSAAGLFAVAALLTAIYALPDAGTRAGVADVDALRSEVEALRFKVAQLESILEENTKTLNSKASILEEDSKLIQTMERDIQLLMNEQESTKLQNTRGISFSAENIKDMEDEVKQLQQEVSKINSNAYPTESLAHDAEKRVEALSLEVKKIEDIIAEQWIQIRQLEQAFVLTKMMASKVHERSKPSKMAFKWPGKDSILKYINNVNLNDNFLRGASYARSCCSHAYKQSRSFVKAMNIFYHEVTRFGKAIRRQSILTTDRPDVFFLGGSSSKRSCISLPYKQFKSSMSSAQKFHRKVQVFIQKTMKSNSYSRDLANEPVAFFLAYLVLISPMWIAWFLYSMKFGSRQ